MVEGFRQGLYAVSGHSDAPLKGVILLQIGDFGCLGCASYRIACLNDDRLNVPVL